MIADRNPIAPVIARIEALCAFARECLEQNRPADARKALDAGRATLALYAPPNYIRFSPPDDLGPRMQSLASETCTVDIQPAPVCWGDLENIWTCIQSLLQAAILEADAVLQVEIFDDQTSPCIAVSIDGPGRFPLVIPSAGFIPLSQEAWGGQWTLASRNGRIDTLPNGFLLRLTGQRMAPEPCPDVVPYIEAIDAALAAGSIAALDQALLAMEGESPAREPVGIKAVWTETADIVQQDFLSRGIAIETLIDPSIPPLQLNRRCLRACFLHFLHWAEDAIPSAGSITFMADYQPASRTVNLALSFNGSRLSPLPAYHASALRLLAAQRLGGTIQIDRATDTAQVDIALSDETGRILDQWMPGFDRFAEPARQMLRLLKSGAPAPPEEFLLGGILESELIRWLMPKLTPATVAHLAHELPDTEPDLPQGAAPRRKKALEQIRRGKPRKEILDPSHAAEILWAIRKHERMLRAMSLEKIPAAALEELAQKLRLGAAHYLTCLRLLAAQGLESAPSA